jgi:hypothetical protein
LAKAVAMVSSPKVKAQNTTVGRRPIRSPMLEKISPPSTMPIVPAEKT